MAAALQPAQAKAPPPVAAPLAAASMLESVLHDSGPTASLSRIPVIAAPPPAPSPRASTAAITAVQRRCDTCEQEEQGDSAAVQMRLEVGAADDPFEHEADAIAGHVMALRDGDIGHAPQSHHAAGPVVQRACSACSAARNDDVQPRRLNADDDQADAPRMRTMRNQTGGESIAASAGQLTSGGTALPVATRTFFEARMGRDLSHVRLHTGLGAETLSRSIAARAFTYRNHIWLGRNEDTGPSFTMAHELAHVLQQTAPGPVGPAAIARSGAATIRRAAGDETEPYFYPSGKPDARKLHSDKHNEAQDALRTHAANKGLLTEVPIPGADRNKVEIGERTGNADLYFAGTKLHPDDKKPALIGVQAIGSGGSPYSLANFTYSDEPSTISRPSGQFNVPKGPKLAVFKTKGVTSFENARAPKVNWATNSLDDTDKMPTNIKLGEIKPAHSLKYREAGVRQLKSYVAGIKAAGDAANRQFPGTNWAPNPKRMLGTEIDIPKDWDPTAKHTAWPVADLVLKWTEVVELNTGKTARQPRIARPRKKVAEPDTISGRWMISRGSRRKDGGDGLFVYYLHPNPADLRKALKNGNLTQGFERRLTDVHHIPAKLRKPPAKATAAAAKPTPLRRNKLRPRPLRIAPHSAPPTVQRKAMTDDFSVTKWEAFRRGKSGLPQESKNNVLDQLHEMAPAEILARVNRNAGLVRWVKDNPDNAPLPTDITSEAAGSKALIDYKFLQKAAFWTSDTARVLGILRDKFGTIVVRGIDRFEAFKQKVSDKIEARKKAALTRDKSKRGSIMLKAAKGVMAALLPVLVMPLVRQTFTLIMNCVESGFKAKMEALFAENGPLADLKKMADDLQGKIDGMSVEIEASIDAAIDTVVGDYDGQVNQVIEDSKNVLEVVGMIKSIANGLRIGACLISLATAPETLGLGAVVGCGVAVADWMLSQLGMSPIDYIIAKTIETCPNKNLIGEMMSRFAVIKQLPAATAQFSIKQIKAAIKAFVPGELLGRPLGDHAAELLCDESKIGDTAEPFVPIRCGGGGAGETVPDLPPELVGKTFKDGDPITAAEREHMGGRKAQVPAQASTGGGGKNTQGETTGSPNSGQRETEVATKDQSGTIGPTPEAFIGWFVHGIGGEGFPSAYDSAKQGGACKAKNVKISIHDKYGIHEIPKTYQIEYCKVYKHEKPKYERTPFQVIFKFKQAQAIDIIDKNTKEILVSYGAAADTEYGAWMGARMKEDK